MKVSEKELEIIQKYKDLLVSLGNKYGWEPSLIAAIGSRESRWGLLLDGNMKGDNGHGHGIMQIDDRSFGTWIKNNNWKDIPTNVEMGVRVLNDKYNYLKDYIDEDWLDQYAVAAYNCGEGTMRKVWSADEDVDNRTIGKNYSEDVFARKAEIEEIVDFGEVSIDSMEPETGKIEVPVPMKIMQRDLVSLYGEPNSTKAKSFLKTIDISAWSVAHIKGYLKNGTFYGHKDLEEPLKKALTCLVNNDLMDELKTWDGCYNVRKMKSGNSWSVHSWGLAIDLNAAENPFNGNANFSDEFVQCFLDAGFEWGGNWTSPKDPMHFQLCHIK